MPDSPNGVNRIVWLRCFIHKGIMTHSESLQGWIEMGATQKSIDKGRSNRDALAEIVANGASVSEAGRALGISETTAFKHWKRIKADLGWQAR